MKKPILIITALFAIGLIAWGIWFFALSKGSGGNTSSNNPSGSSLSVQSQTQSGASVPIQGITSPQNPEVAKAFLGEMQNANQTALGGTVLVSPYALQVWGGANEGGEALLENVPSTGWTLVSLGGGEWSALALMQEGVPQSIAMQLITGLSGGTPPPVTSPINIPPGNTLTIGTPQGSVVMNNFYNSADYIAQNQRAIVIQQSSTYDIVYNVSDSGFTLTVFSMPFETVRQTAEAALLNLLGISKQDACKLSVYENVTGNASGQYAGRSFPLSFCAPSAVGQ